MEKTANGDGPQYYCVGRDEAERTLRQVDPDGFGWYDGLYGFKNSPPWFKSLTVFLGAIDVLVIAALVLLGLILLLKEGVPVLWGKVSRAARKGGSK